MASYHVINTNQGPIRGRELRAESFSKKIYFAFQGIPYARPPVGPLRFRDPQPAQPWPGVRDALQEGPSCPQKHVILRELTGEEDNCLVLNVYTTQLPSAGGGGRPVMVWIHGGGFTFGSGNTDLHGPDYWMERDVVVVTCNYRVGALGFLSLGTPEVPGNAGLKDQVMVLRWVRQNISHFGGDAGNVTLFGESAGAASVHYHLLSPMSRGLFHRAILISGSSLNSWAFSQNAVERSFLLAERLGCKSNNPQELLHFLESISAFDLVKVQHKVVSSQDKQDIRVFPFVPCVEPTSGPGERFLTEEPRTLLQQGLVAPVPLIIGTNDKEGMLILNDVPHTDEYLKILNGSFSRIVPENLGLPINAVEKIRTFFFKDKPVDWSTLDEYLDYYSDVFFNLGIDEMIRLHLACDNSPLFVYSFSFDGQLGLLSWFLRQLYPQCTLKGVCHADDIGYMFNYSLPGPPQLAPGSPEETVIFNMTSMWAHFAAFGNPNKPGLNVKWEPAMKDTSGWTNYLELNESLDMKAARLNCGRMQFWDDLRKLGKSKLQKL